MACLINNLLFLYLQLSILMIFFNKRPSLFVPLLRGLYFSFSTASKIGTDTNFNLLFERLKLNVQKSQKLEKALIDASLGESKTTQFMNPEKARIQINKLSPLVSLHDQIIAVLKNIQDLNQMKKETKDPQEMKLISEQLTELEKKKEELKNQSLKQLVPPDLYDDCQEITLEFRSGAGGSQSCLFVEEFSNMIFGYCDSMGWRTQVISSLKDSTINAGFRSLMAKVTGPDVYKILKCESGVHKVIRVPETQAKGRLHSSTISMVVMPSVPFDFTVNDKDIKYEYMRSSGPGGQSVNKTESACRATHIPTGMSVFIQEDRSQDRNRKRATQILKQRLFEIEYKKNVEEESKKRKSQMGTMDRSEKIRTYNYQQDRITDHRTGLTLFGMESMMAGEYLPKFIEAYQQKIYEEKLQVLLEDLKKSLKQ